jgi:hypothetical protein
LEYQVESNGMVGFAESVFAERGEDSMNRNCRGYLRTMRAIVAQIRNWADAIYELE